MTSRSEQAGAMRADYISGQLDETNAAADDPFSLFRSWFTDVKQAQAALATATIQATEAVQGILAGYQLEPNAVHLSTARLGEDGVPRPSGRMVLFKSASPDTGFSFYTNVHSRKAGELLVESARTREVRHAAMTWHWGERQVRAEGPVTQMARALASQYWETRPRASQLGAWASGRPDATKSISLTAGEDVAQIPADMRGWRGTQSEEVEGRGELERRYARVVAMFSNHTVIPMPPFWGGFHLAPTRIEFWQGRSGRLHDRLLYTRPSPTSSWTTPNRLCP